MEQAAAPLAGIALAAALLLGGCGGEPAPAAPPDLSFDFSRPVAGTALGDRWSLLPDSHRHWFAEGWQGPQGPGLWAVGPRTVLYLDLPPRDTTLLLTCGAPPGSGGGPVQVTVNGIPVGDFTPPRCLVLPLLGTVGARTRRLELPAAALGADLDRIVLEGPAAAAGGRLFLLSDLRAICSPAGEAGEAVRDGGTAAAPLADEVPDGGPAPPAPVTASPPPPAGPTPDLLVVLMDAARPDHCGCYGYPRATTPTLDSLAAGGVVMRQAVTPAPYTLCSLPTIMTGRHWRRHGVVSHGQAWPDSLLTLAEVLRGEGFRTLGITGNAYMSAATGSDQGFDELIPTWGEGVEPEPLAHLARCLAAGLPDRPVFLYVHLMRPHEPYEPRPQHDLWSEPGYGGPVTGGIEDVRRLNGELAAGTMEEADRQRLIDLYDANLRSADAELAGILDQWRRLGRPRPLVTVVLSDHGEAFGEHGLFGHNRDLHPEMVGVPLVLSPAAACAPAAALAAAPFSLADLAPLLLRILGLPPRLGSPAPGPILLRADSGPPYGLRAGRWLAIHAGPLRQFLYDLDEDPRAATNLRASRPSLYRSLVERMRSELTGRPAPAPPAARLDESDLRRLRSVGYL